MASITSSEYGDSIVNATGYTLAVWCLNSSDNETVNEDRLHSLAYAVQIRDIYSMSQERALEVYGELVRDFDEDMDTFLIDREHALMASTTGKELSRDYPFSLRAIIPVETGKQLMITALAHPNDALSYFACWMIDRYWDDIYTLCKGTVERLASGSLMESADSAEQG